jgi:zinc/manganese transport system substrate-binding protein
MVETDVKASMAKLPPAHRKLITTHDAFGYFGRREHGQQASAKDLAKIIRQIKAEKVPAVFLENVTDHRLLDQIARETGAKIGGTRYSDAFSDST